MGRWGLTSPACRGLTEPRPAPGLAVGLQKRSLNPTSGTTDLLHESGVLAGKGDPGEGTKPLPESRLCSPSEEARLLFLKPLE
uniref:Uncharacterized protein n=1 Tax=Rangifer tarandus platyrhynchus TaxID=3082113 RepID=A0ACB0EIL6_RANTA|nr:unnamed protein product [Rangifer tarandus platyrhynchus]